MKLYTESTEDEQFQVTWKTLLRGDSEDAKPIPCSEMCSTLAEAQELYDTLMNKTGDHVRDAKIVHRYTSNVFSYTDWQDVDPSQNSLES